MTDFAGSRRLAIENLTVNDHLTGHAEGNKEVGKGFRFHHPVKQLRTDGSGSDIVLHFHLQPKALSQFRTKIVFCPAFMEDVVDLIHTAIDHARQANADTQQFFPGDRRCSQKIRDFLRQSLQSYLIFIQRLIGIPNCNNVAPDIRQNITGSINTHIDTADIVCLRNKFQHHPGPSCALGFFCRRNGFPQKTGTDHGIDHAGDGCGGQSQLLGNLYPGNGTVPVDVFLDQIVVALLQKLMVASLFAHKVILQIHCTSYSIEGDVTLSIVTFMKNPT